MVAQQMKLEADIPHCAFALCRNTLEYLHAGLTPVMYDRDTGAVDKTDAGAFPKACGLQEHRQGNETAWQEYLQY